MSTTQQVPIANPLYLDVDGIRHATGWIEANAGIFVLDRGGRIDASDAVYSQLRIWQDVNQNAVSEAGELKTLAELNIASIGVAGTASNVNLGNGNSMPLAGSFTRIDGSSGTSGTPDVSGSLLLASNNFYRDFTDAIYQ